MNSARDCTLRRFYSSSTFTTAMMTIITPVVVPERRGTREFGGSCVLKTTEIFASVEGRSSKTIVTVVPDRPAPPPDDHGCLAPCFPTCRTPVYRAGQVITGHLLVRPVTRLVISGRFNDNLGCCVRYVKFWMQLLRCLNLYTSGHWIAACDIEPPSPLAR